MLYTIFVKKLTSYPIYDNVYVQNLLVVDFCQILSYFRHTAFFYVVWLFVCLGGKCETKINQNVQKKTNLKTSLNNLEKIE